MRDPGVTTGRRGFTQTEMVVVIGIMAVLVALLMPSLGSAIKTARKLEDLNRLRQIGMAWTQYSQMHDDAVLPGYLSVAAQDDWNVQYRYADGEVMSPAPNYTPTGDPEGNMAGPWVWRLMPYLDFDFDVMLGYLGDEGGKIDTRRRALD
ncbi:MAG: type II secretion system protein, partial [Planctomycetes bacterium]|nr:type II secretion system protein [Planctomycetota bacterium]